MTLPTNQTGLGLNPDQLQYLKTWISRTQSDANTTKSGIANLIDDILANLDELEKWIEEQP